MGSEHHQAPVGVTLDRRSLGTSNPAINKGKHMTTRKVLVVGCGLGGATAAAALAQRGIAVDVVERRPEHAALGIGLTLGGNALRALDDIGALEEVVMKGVTYSHMDFCDNNGELLYTAEITFGGGHIPASVSMARPDLHEILVDLARKAGASIQMGTTITGFDQDASQVTVRLSDGATRSYDAVVGFDGVHSQLRQMLFPEAGEASYTGYAVWRVGAARPADLERFRMLITPGGPRALMVPLTQGSMFYGLLTPEPDPARIHPEHFATTLREQVRHFEVGLGDVVADLDDPNASDRIAYTPVEEVRLELPWCVGRVGLGGDAVHATAPTLAQGAGMAIEDAIVLAEHLSEMASVEEALDAYATRRFPRTRFVQNVSYGILKAELEPSDAPPPTAQEAIERMQSVWSALYEPI